jgi:hypothetical protein
MDMVELDIDENQMSHYVLNIFGRIIRLEEKRTGRMSGMRFFCRMDVSIYRHLSTGEHQFFVNEITRTHGAALFADWDTLRRMDDWMFPSMSKTFHYAATQKLFQSPGNSFVI